MSSDYYAGANLNIARFIPGSCIRILEIGCAEGALGAHLIAERGCEHWGVELNAAAASVARERLTKVFHADIESLTELPFPAEYFDCLIFGDVLEHLLEPEQLLARLKRHLMSKATLVCNVPNIAHWSVVVELLRGDFPYADSGLLDRTHRTFFTPKTLREMLFKSGFAVRRFEPFLFPSHATEVLKDAAQRLGINPGLAANTLDTYQFLVQADLTPDPTRHPDKRELLLRSRMPLRKGVDGMVSIIVVTYNSESTIEECLSSLLQTKHQDDEIIVIDNGSKDSTVQLLQRMSRRDSSLKLITSEENLGFSKANNRGIQDSDGEYVVVANPDTVFYDGWREAFLHVLEEPGCGAVGPLSDAVSGGQQVGTRVGNWTGDSHENLAGYISQAYSGQVEPTKLIFGLCLGVKRTTLSDVGGFDEAMFLGAEDLEFSWRLRQLGYAIKIALDVFVRHHHHISFSSLETSVSETLIRQSDLALKRKLEDFYGDLTGITSTDLWGIPIFDPILQDVTAPDFDEPRNI